VWAGWALSRTGPTLSSGGAGLPPSLRRYSLLQAVMIRASCRSARHQGGGDLQDLQVTSRFSGGLKRGKTTGSATERAAGGEVLNDGACWRKVAGVSQPIVDTENEAVGRFSLIFATYRDVFGGRPKRSSGVFGAWGRRGQRGYEPAASARARPWAFDRWLLVVTLRTTLDPGGTNGQRIVALTVYDKPYGRQACFAFYTPGLFAAPN